MRTAEIEAAFDRIGDGARWRRVRCGVPAAGGVLELLRWPV